MLYVKLCSLLAIILDLIA